MILSRIVAWATVPFFTAGMGIGIWLEYRLGLSFGYEEVMLTLGFGTFAIVGSLLVAKRPDNRISWIMVAIGLMAGLFPTAETYAAYVMTVRGVPDTLAVLGAWLNVIYWVPLMVLAFIYLPLLFPDGHLLSRWWLPVAVIPGIATMGFVVLGAFRQTLIGQSLGYRINNPIGIEGVPTSENHPISASFIIMIAIGLLGAAAAVFVRFRRSTGVERQQLKIFLFATALVPILLITAALPFVGDLLFGLVIVAVPTAIGVAVLRYRLYDIDIIIRRTLVYSILTAFLALIYLGLVITLEGALRTLAGGSGQVATVISTLVIAALFTPLRRRVQDIIDRRFYRQKYNADQALAEFAATARAETDLEALSAQVVGIVQETIQPEQVLLWLKPLKQIDRL